MGVVLERSRGKRVYIFTWAIAYLWFLAAAWPGWMTPNDSMSMFASAKSGAYEDWYSPLLQFVWRWLGASVIGPTGLFVLQVTVFWLGLLLIGNWLVRRGRRWAPLIFVAAFALPWTWILGWMLKDAVLVALFTLAVGLAAASGDAVTPTRSRSLATVSAVALGLMVGVTWYVLPVALVALLALLLFPGGLVGARDWRRRAAIVPVLGLIVTGAVLFLFQRVVVAPAPKYAAATPLLLDLARVECNVLTPEERSQGRHVIPTALLGLKPGIDLCDRFDWRDLTPLLLWGADSERVIASQDGYSHIKIPASPEEQRLVISAWWDAIRSNPAVIFEGKARQFLALLNSDVGPWWSPSEQITLRPSVSVDGGVGGRPQGEWLSAGGIPLAAAAAVSAVVSDALLGFGQGALGLFFVFVVPFAMALVATRRGLPLSRVGAALLLPGLWALWFGAIAPGLDPRYLTPAMAWSFVIAALVLGAREADAQPRRG